MSVFKKKVEPSLLNINIPITRGTSTAFASTMDNKEAVKNNLRSLLMTARGERVLSDFGTNLRRMIFDPADPAYADEVKQELTSSVQKWMPYLQVIEVKTTFIGENSNQLSVFVRYRFTDSQYEDTLNIIYNNIGMS